MKAFVTGSTGLLGSNLVRVLVEQGHEVKSMARSPEKALHVFPGLNVEVVTGDMLDVPGFGPSLEGCDVLFHVAAYFREFYQPGDHWTMLKAVNVDGTVRLLQEAERRGVPKVIHTSSSAIIGLKDDGSPGDETTPPPSYAETNLYVKSKVLAEQAIRDFLQSHSLPVVLILPGWMFGPGDSGPTDSGRLVQAYLQRRVPGVFKGGSCIADARDVAAAMIAAVERGRPGERYIVGGPYMTFEEILKTMEHVTGIPAPRLRFSYPLVRMYARMSELYGRLTDRPVLVTTHASRLMHAAISATSNKAVQELGAEFRPFEDTIRDEVAWFRANA